MRLLLKELYEETKLDRNNGKECPSFPKCFASCKIENRKLMPPTGAYVGEEYNKNRILFVGINTNRGSSDSEQFYSCYDWISGDDNFIAGAIHRIVKKVLDNPELMPAETKEHFAFTNAIKCSVDKNAGKPTNSMTSNCLYYHKYLHQEIRILKPKIIFTLGSIPFDGIKSEYVDLVSFPDLSFKDWLFALKKDNHTIQVVGLYNPAGYQNIRSINKEIKLNNKIRNSWSKFVPDNLEGNINLGEILEKRYPESQRIDRSNPFYDALFNKLYSIVKRKDNYAI